MTAWEGIRLTARRELRERTREKSFIISTAVTLLILLGILIVPRLLGGGPDTFEVGIVGEASAPVGMALERQAGATGTEVDLRPLPDRAAAERALRDGDLDFAVVGGGEIIVESELDPEAAALVQSAARSARVRQDLLDAGLSPGQVDEALTAPPLPVTALEPADEAENAREGLALAAVIVLYGQLIGYGFAVGSGVVEEKSSRVVEVILATIRPLQLLTGKIAGIGLVGLLQLGIITVVGLTVAVGSGTIELPPGWAGALGWVFAWFLLGYAFYSTLFAVAGALVSRQEEMQNTMQPITLVLVAAFFAGLFALRSPDSLAARVIGFLPPSAPLVMPSRIVGGDAAAWEVALAAAIMLASIALLLPLVARIYSGAVLRTGARVKLGDAWRSTTSQRT